MAPARVAANQVATVETRPPEWAGWLGLVVLIGVLALVAWWLFASPIRGPVQPSAAPRHILRVRYRMGLVVLASFILLRLGASWDELWHRLYGLPFGEDLLWAPHLLMYASFALNVGMVGFGLSMALRGHGDLRSRFRREPLLAMLGLLAAFGFAFIPVDLVWHQVIGPDLTAASPPHVVGGISTSAVGLAGVALVLSTTTRAAWHGVFDRAWGVDAVVLGVLALLALNWLQLLTTEWDWGNRIAELRPAWLYPVLVGSVGATFAHLALHTTRRVGAATCLAMVALAWHAATVGVFRASLPPGPIVAAHAVLVPAAVALDVWYALALVRTAGPRASTRVEVAGAVVYAAVLLMTLVPYAAAFMRVPVFDGASVSVAFITTTLAVVLASVPSARLGAWLGSVGRAGRDSYAARSAWPSQPSMRSAVVGRAK